ncbi:putative PKS/NRPS-like protein biosynthetic cluster [Aspergillus tubingensis]|uniref:Fatty acyl-CoA reductase n=1 Tax=Aspergillus tubingensis TaxID=5068 RepID=A0A9W6ALG0_ASPTU|nr:putative PKS/NRPS-like protein biosynthetic cluster [Aspergillus tubingensis]GLA69503.1 putative PKS/NRPS-like protein biosynthetic cluster [Aspergillus tubingensis]GLA84550.1 putative PKS/NRPS-like protein biosynthetic cluster [Aspergillus tubingensis]GLA94955.1 putative PKS/NRPS-like protein biosynthetic cluster [Aspergillus tubingensis]
MLDYYQGKTIFITGGSGFLGTALVHRIATTVEFKHIYLLQRGGRSGLSGKWHQHLPFDAAQWLLDHPRITILDGDMMKPSLGLGADHIEMLKRNTHIIIHAASSINLAQRLQKMWPSVIRATEYAVELGLQCDKLERFVYVSTAYTNTHLCSLSPKGDVDMEERIVSLESTSPNNGNSTVDEEYSELQSRGSTKEYESNDFPWGYGYAKHLSERLVTDRFTKHGKYDRLLILRPSVIGPAESLPYPGYAIPTSTPMTMIAALFVNHTAFSFELSSRLDDPESDSNLDEVPVDIVVDRLLAHLAYQSQGCVHAWVKRNGWNTRSDAISRLYKIFGTSFNFHEEKTEQLMPKLSVEERRTLRLFNTRKVGAFELASRSKQMYDCSTIFARKIAYPYRAFYQLLWIIWWVYVKLIVAWAGFDLRTVTRQLFAGRKVH